MIVLPTIIFRYKKLLLIVAIVLLLSILATQWYSAQTAKPVDSAPVMRGEIAEVLTLSGKIDADEKANLQFQTGGLVSWVGVKKGDTVKKHQAIASLDKRQLHNTLQQYLNTYRYNRDAFDQSVANTNGLVFTDTFKRTIDQAQQTMDNSVLDVELQTLLLQLATISTPIDGIVTELPVSYPNINIATNTLVATVVNPTTIYFDVNADQTEVVLLSIGEVGEVTLDAYPDKKLVAVISDISFSPKKDESGTVYQVKMALNTVDNSTYRYKLGMTGDSEFTTKHASQVLYIPSRYVKTDENNKKYVYKGAKREKVFVTIGIDNGETTEISGNIVEGDRVYD